MDSTQAGVLSEDNSSGVIATAVMGQEVIRVLACASEYRDKETGNHVVRVGRYAGIIARQLGVESEVVELIEQAATLHDVGKVGIPDAILLKPGKLSADEFEIMQRHCLFGGSILAGISRGGNPSLKAAGSIQRMCQSPILQVAATIAMSHHEKWDGSGYPLGLAGEAIPIESRITAVADVFDALGSSRPYKKALPLEQCLDILEQGRERHFDPIVLDAFFVRLEEIVFVSRELADP